MFCTRDIPGQIAPDPGEARIEGIGALALTALPMPGQTAAEVLEQHNSSFWAWSKVHQSQSMQATVKQGGGRSWLWSLCTGLHCWTPKYEPAHSHPLYTEELVEGWQHGSRNPARALSRAAQICPHFTLILFGFMLWYVNSAALLSSLRYQYQGTNKSCSVVFINFFPSTLFRLYSGSDFNQPFHPLLKTEDTWPSYAYKWESWLHWNVLWCIIFPCNNHCYDRFPLRQTQHNAELMCVLSLIVCVDRFGISKINWITSSGLSPLSEMICPASLHSELSWFQSEL